MSPAKRSLSSKLTKHSKPHKLILRSYQVGFGDCYLLTFQYKVAGGSTEDRHVLIDFGTTARPKVSPRDLMLRVAKDIKAKCKGKLHAVVATHRHKDHISGFTTNEEGTATGNIIASCNPDVVVQPWTENPKAKRDAKSFTGAHRSPNKSFLSSLDNMHAISSSILAEAKHLSSGLSKHLVGQLEFLAADNAGEKDPANKSAIDNLNEMAKDRLGNFYVSFGTESGLEQVLPGVKTHVLGPPTIKESKRTLSEAFEDPEFWMLHASAGEPIRGEGDLLFSSYQASYSNQLNPLHTRWLIRRLHIARANQLLEIVRILDDALNNTSLILLFEVNGKKFLFPGDAQIENWSYALHDAPEAKLKEIKALLEDVLVYKVGHHGSRNATPRSLWKMFARRRDKQSNGDLQTIVSTREEKHGDTAARTEVPRDALVTALKKGSKYFSTQELTGDENISKAFTIDL